MRIAYLRRTDRQTDRGTSALVELRFAAKKLGSNHGFKYFQNLSFLYMSKMANGNMWTSFDIQKCFGGLKLSVFNHKISNEV